jgi:hypothetical protein
MWTIITEGVIGTCMSLAFNISTASVFFVVVTVTLGALPLVIINKLLCQFGWDVDML